jgi:hypothetical protein
MSELLGLLCMLGLLALLLIGFITVLRWLGGSLGSAPEPVRLPASSANPAPVVYREAFCAGCGADTEATDIFCQQCGRPQPQSLRAAQQELAVAERILHQLHQAQRLDAESFARVSQALQDERTRLTASANPLAVQPAPTSQPVVAAPTVSAPSTAHAPQLPEPVSVTPAAPVTGPAAPRRPLSEVLTVFMEESSIRWGELLGGLLIIGCSLALVINQWSEIAERPLLKFGVFMGLTAGLFGLGFYSAHKWKLPTTSRGVLLTATLLVPLNFLAVTAFGRTTAASLGIVIAESITWLVFAGLVWLASRVVAPAAQLWLTSGTLGSSLALLLAKHFAPAGLYWRSWLLLGVLPVLTYGATVGAAVWEARRRTPAEVERTAYGLFTVIGVSAFATLLPLGLLQLRAGNWNRALHENAPFVALLGLPALAVGWWLWRNLRASTLATERTIAASLGLCGAGLLLGSTLLAFPLVDSLTVIAMLNAIVWVWAAWRYGLRPLRWLALAQIVWAFLLLALLALGRLAWGLDDARVLLSQLFSNASGVLWLFVFAGLSGVAEWRRARNSEQSVTQDLAAAGLLAGLVSLLLVSLHSFGVAGDPRHLAWVYGFYTLAAFVLAWRRAELPYSWGGLLLLGGVCVQTCVFRYGWPLGWRHAGIVSVLAFATCAGLLALASLWHSEAAQRLFARPALLTAWGSAAGASLALLTHNQGLNFWYLAPLVLVALTCVLYARRLGSQAAAAGGGILFNLAVSSGYVISVKRLGHSIGSHELARLAQLNLLTGSLYVLGWLRRTRATGPLAWMRWQVRAIVVGELLVLARAAFRLIVAPDNPSIFVQTYGDALGWLVLGLIALSYVSAHAVGASPSESNAGAPAQLPDSRTSNRSVHVAQLALGLLAGGVLLACTLHHFERQNWLGYHTLLAVTVVTAWAMLWLLWQRGRVAEGPPNRWRRWLRALPTTREADNATFAAVGLSVITVLLGLRGFEAPGGPWRSVCAIGAMAGLHLGLALARRNNAYFYAAGLLACLGLTEWIFGYSRGGGSLLDVAMLNAAALAAIALVSLVLELKLLRPAPVSQTPAFHQFAAVLLLALTCWKIAFGLALDFTGSAPLAIQGWTGGLALVAVLSLCLACVWDGLFVYRFLVLFVAGLAALGALVDRQNWQAQALGICGAVALTGYGLLAAWLWRRRAALAQVLRQVRVPQLDWRGTAGLWWLSSGNAVLAVGAVLSVGWSVLAVERLSGRVLAASAALLAPLALGWVAHGEQRLRQQILAVVLVFAAAVFWSWAWITSPNPHPLERLVLWLAWAGGGALVFFVLEAAQQADWATWLRDWETAVRRVVYGIGLLGLSVLALVLSIEGVDLSLTGTVQAPYWSKAVVTVLLLALTAAQIGFALWSGRDPFNWQLEKRGRYVYAAEFFAVLTLVHLRLVAPWLFSGMFKAYWPLFVLVLAFVGVGVSEQLRRRGRLTLAEPLARTGVFLPLLPSLGFWLAESRVDYAGLLLAVGLFYGLLSVMRQSFGFGLLAALAANGGWWHWLHRAEDYGFLAHPQVWLIPAALSVMLAAHFNREQLSQEQLTTIRYTALMTIYVSSTADIFITGVGRSPWLPLVLAVLSVAGVLLGMLLRVRAYLFLGTAFLLLAVLTMVWHAALSLGWGWLWYVVGIGFGILILYLFAMFERKREQVLGLVEQLKGWQA